MRLWRDEVRSDLRERVEAGEFDSPNKALIEQRLKQLSPEEQVRYRKAMNRVIFWNLFLIILVGVPTLGFGLIFLFPFLPSTQRVDYRFGLLTEDEMRFDETSFGSFMKFSNKFGPRGIRVDDTGQRDLGESRSTF